jgi:acetyl-CoA decarbonylase/synthase complex subunit alpha
MQAIVAAWARAGSPVVIGPNSAFGWKRYLLGNKWDWEKWCSYLMMAATEGREKKLHEPAPKHMIVPVETKEEAVTTLLFLWNKGTSAFDGRQRSLETCIEEHLKAFDEYPDEWYLFVRSDLDLPQRDKMTMLKKLREEHGWEIDRVRIKKQTLPDGRLVSREEFADQYGITNDFITKVRRLIAKPVGWRK